MGAYFGASWHEAGVMFGLFKSDPVKKLRKQYSAKLEEAM